MAIRQNLVVLSGCIDRKADDIKHVAFNNGNTMDVFRIRVSVEQEGASQEDAFEYFYVDFFGGNAAFVKQNLPVGKYITVEGECAVRTIEKEQNGETVRTENYLIKAREFNASEDLLFHENNIRLMGYLAKDPVLCVGSDGMAELEVDVNRRGDTQKFDTFHVMVPQSLVEHVPANYRSGDAVAVSGRMLPASIENDTCYHNARIIADSIKNPAMHTANASVMASETAQVGVSQSAEASASASTEPSLEEVKEALQMLKEAPFRSTIDSISSEICQNPDFLESVGSFSKWQRKPDVLVHTLVKAFRAAASNPDRLEDMRYALAHFHYYRLVDASSYRYLKLEFVAAQEENEQQILPFQPGEYNFEEDCFWDMKRESLRKAIEKSDAEQRAVAGREEELPYPLTQRVYSKEDREWQRTPLPEIWKENDVIPTEEDFAWWDNYRNRDGVVDFDLIEDTDYIFFARAKALILMNPEYITQFPIVPYAPGGVLATNACYGLSDARLFEAIINKHYFWLKKYYCQKVRIRRAEEKLAKATEEDAYCKLTEELDALKKDLQRLEETKPANAERDALLIRYADRALKVLCTKATDGGFDCIPKKFAIVNPMTYPEYAPVARSEFEIGRRVVSEVPAMMKYAGEDLLNDAELIFTTYEMKDHDLDVLRFAGKEFFMKHMKAFRGMMEENPAIVTVFARGLLLSEPKFARQAVIWNPMTYQYFKSSVKKHPDVMCIAKEANVLEGDSSSVKKFLGKYF